MELDFGNLVALVQLLELPHGNRGEGLRELDRQRGPMFFYFDSRGGSVASHRLVRDGAVAIWLAQSHVFFVAGRNRQGFLLEIDTLGLFLAVNRASVGGGASHGRQVLGRRDAVGPAFDADGLATLSGTLHLEIEIGYEYAID